MDNKDLVSIITPVFNNLAFTTQLMDSLERNDNDWPFELILIDNGSTDGTREFVTNSKYKMNGQYIRNESNLGFAAANNQGSRVAKGNFLLLLNNDMIVTKGFLSAMMSVFSEEKAVGAVGAKLIFPGSGLIQHAGVFELENGLPDHAHFNRQADYPPANKREAVFAVTGAAMLVPKSLYNELGGLDEEYTNGWEDVDLCQKIRQAGMNIYYEPRAVIYHYESRTEGRYLNDVRNMNIYLKRWVLNKI
jgi:GT2 family glycosyltransferase